MSSVTLSLCLAAILALTLQIGCAATPDAASGSYEQDRIQPSAENPRYWQYQGQTVLLLGASDDDNLFQWPEEKLIPQLDKLQAAGGNVIRNTMSDRDEGDLRAFVQVEPGKYDLAQPNPAYWDRFETMLRETAKRNIFVQIEVWDRFDHSRDQWQSDPYNPANNVNYTYEESGFEPEYPAHPNTNLQPFFFTPPTMKDIPVVRQVQEAFVEKMLEHSLKYDHVLYCIDNETNGPEAWPTYWAQFIRDRSEAAGRPIEITEMWDEWRVFHKMHQRTVAHPERYDYIDLSQNNQQVGQDNWDNAQIIWNQIADNPRPINSTKIYGSPHWANRWEGRTTHNALSNFWRNLHAGFASSRFHRPDAGPGLSEPAIRQIEMARQWQQHHDVFRAQPDSKYQLLGRRENNEAYASVVPGESWSVFFPAGGEVVLETGSDAAKTVRWGNLDDGTWTDPASADDENLTLTAPGEGMWLAVVQAAD
ncbi:MAG: DUF6298 domain-containing protein [Phycisphaeraceae bacterium]